MNIIDGNKITTFKKKRSINKKKLYIAIAIAVLVVIFITFFALYVANRDMRNWIDQYILRKNVYSENTPSIPINMDNSNSIFAYDNYIALLNKTNLTTYSSSGKKNFETEISINNPIYAVNDRFLCLAEQNGNKLCLINGQNILWQNEVEGQISKVSVNKNGYVSVIVTGTSYKTIVITYSPKGNELFKTFLSYTIATDISISNNNKYLAIAEVSTSGSQVQSTIRIILIESASTGASSSTVYVYPANLGQIISKIAYQDKDKLICMYDDSVHMIQNNNDSKIIDIDLSKDLFCDIHIKDHIVKVAEKPSGLFSNIEVQITNINSNKQSIYILDSIPKSMRVSENAIALNLGTEIHFIDTNGWLIKKYTSKQEVKDIVLASNIAAIIYKDKIEFINI